MSSITDLSQTKQLLQQRCTLTLHPQDHLIIQLRHDSK